MSPPAYEAAYLELLFDLLVDGQDRPDRTGVGRRSLFGRKLVVDLRSSFPLLTTKRLHTRSIVVELMWFLQGLTNSRWLEDRRVTIWSEWADAAGELGPIYGRQWRSWPCPDGRAVDQISVSLDLLRRDPFSSRNVVSAWNVAELDAMAIPPCHCLFQFYVEGEAGPNRLSCQVYQRSADVFLGLPFNVASYALLTCLMARAAGLEPGLLHHVVGDAHLYRNHLDAAREQMTRAPRALPRLVIPDVVDLFAFEAGDVCFAGYDPHPPIKAEVAI